MKKAHETIAAVKTINYTASTKVLQSLTETTPPFLEIAVSAVIQVAIIAFADKPAQQPLDIAVDKYWIR